ncbi:MAG: hypothetical protein M1839_002304 [Geoglossum umbratile]|nr:MAG: hypothetical protein M1839_002304 [Geoglossum umbratile]
MRECAQHEVRGLIETIVLEKRRRVKGKRLNLLQGEDTALLVEKENAKQQRREGIESRKAKTAAVRERKTRGKEERTAAIAANRQLIEDQKAHQIAERAAQKAFLEAEKLAKTRDKAELVARRKSMIQGARKRP